MNEKKSIDPIPVAFVLLLCVAVGFLISKGVQFGLAKYNEYWRDNNVAYGRDLSFFGLDAIDQDKEPEDASLRDSALKLLYAHINDKTVKSCGTDISISNEYFKMIDPNNEINEPIDRWCSLSAFITLQKQDKAIVAFEYSIIPQSNERAESYCRDTFKTRPCSRMYLELKDGVWTVTDVLIIP